MRMGWSTRAGIRYLAPSQPVWTALQAFVSALQLRHPLVTHVTILYDGNVVWGRSSPGMRSLYTYLRMHAFHVLRGTYVPDLRAFALATSHAKAAAAPPDAAKLGPRAATATSGGGGGGAD